MRAQIWGVEFWPVGTLSKAYTSGEDPDACEVPEELVREFIAACEQMNAVQRKLEQVEGAGFICNEFEYAAQEARRILGV